MRDHHAYQHWGIGHMSHPEDPTGCCSEPEGARVHRCPEWTGHAFCRLPFGHGGDCEPVE